MNPMVPGTNSSQGYTLYILYIANSPPPPSTPIKLIKPCSVNVIKTAVFPQTMQKIYFEYQKGPSIETTSPMGLTSRCFMCAKKNIVRYSLSVKPCLFWLSFTICSNIYILYDPYPEPDPDPDPDPDPHKNDTDPKHSLSLKG